MIYGVAAYSLNLELSLNIAASVEGWFDDHWSWQWIFWDTALLAPLMLICIYFGMPRQPINRALLKTADWAGMLYASVGFSLLYAGLDQGNRLDWLKSGLINALLLGGSLLLVVFVIHELTYKRPWINLRFAAGGNMPLLLLFISFFRFVILSTSYIIPQYLTTVQNYRAIEIGGALKWVALPQFLSAPAVATVLRFVDARLTMAFGFALVGCACFMAGQLTHDWVSEDFLRSQLFQAVGQSFGLTSLVWFALKHLEPSEIFTFGAVLQTGRCSARNSVPPLSKHSCACASRPIPISLVCMSMPVRCSPISDWSSTPKPSSGAPSATRKPRTRATALLAHAVQKQAYVLAYIDGFMVLGFASSARCY